MTMAKVLVHAASKVRWRSVLWAVFIAVTAVTAVRGSVERLFEVARTAMEGSRGDRGSHAVGRAREDQQCVQRDRPWVTLSYAQTIDGSM